MVEGMSRALDKQLQYQTGNQERYGIQNDEDNPERNRTFLSDSVQGNNYYTMQNSNLNCLSLLNFKTIYYTIYYYFQVRQDIERRMR